VHKVPLPDSDGGSSHVADVVKNTEKLCGFIAESLPSVAGQIVLPQGNLNEVYDTVRAAGGVCIADEVQTGFGRIGTHFWGFESYGVVPDIVVLGKPIGNGHPIGAVITTRAIADSFDNGMEFFSTFGGNTVSCAIGLAVLEVVQEENLQAHALNIGEQLIHGLKDLQSRHQLIGDIRGAGLFLGVELAQEATRIVNRMRDNRILIGAEGPLHNVLKIRPPMPFSQTDADHFLTTLGKLLMT
jgi:4-aminobutyrate aminotransferase-like enzyme